MLNYRVDVVAWRLQQEFSVISDLLKSAQETSYKNLVFHVQDCSDSAPGDVSVPPLILQPLIENALQKDADLARTNKGLLLRVDVVAYYQGLDCGGERFILSVISSVIESNLWNDPTIIETVQSVEDSQLLTPPPESEIARQTTA